MICVTSKQYLVNVELYGFFFMKNVLFFLFSPTLRNSFPVTLTTTELNGEYQKAAALIRGYDSPLSYLE